MASSAESCIYDDGSDSETPTPKEKHQCDAKISPAKFEATNILSTLDHQQQNAVHTSSAKLNEICSASTTTTPATQEEEQLVNHFPIDEIPEPIRVLDDIISEFEDTSKPAVAVNGENQSEDDGYMSLSRKNMHRQSSPSRVIRGLIPAANALNKNFNEYGGNNGPVHFGDEMHALSRSNSPDKNVTLPKARQPAAFAESKNYSSLPCCGGRAITGASKYRGGSCNGERNALGVDISAVHKAVLRGNLAKLPEPIVNEHPVTIYPGRSSDGRRGRSHRTIASSSTRDASRDNTDTDEAQTRSMGYNPKKIKNFGLAWEIYFDDGSRKLKERPQIKQNAKEKFRTTDETSKGRRQQHNEEPSMLGKGTFVIRRGVKKPPRAMDIFKTVTGPEATLSTKHHQTLPVKPSSTEPIMPANNRTRSLEHKNTSSNIARRLKQDCAGPPNSGYGRIEWEISDKAKQFRAFNARAQQELGLRKIMSTAVAPPGAVGGRRGIPSVQLASARLQSPRQTASMVMPSSARERLSLNICADPKLGKKSTVQNLAANAAKNDKTTSIGHKASSKDFTRASKQIESPLSPQSFNGQPYCFERDELDGIHPNFDVCNVFLYKNNETITQDYNDLRSSSTTTPHTDLAPTLEEDEEQYSDLSYGAPPPPKQVECNISALLRGDLEVVRLGEIIPPPKRTLEFRPGVHKSESAKEMLLSQNVFGPLPPSPPSSNPDLFDYDAPLPPSPKDPSTVVVVATADERLRPPYMRTTSAEIHTHSTHSMDERRNRDNKSVLRHMSDDLPLPPPIFDNLAPVVPPHRGYSVNAMKSWSIDSKYKKRSPKLMGGGTYGSGITTPTGPPTSVGMGSPCEGAYAGGTAKRFVSYGTKRSLKQSPREEQRLQTSCSLPETPIFARGCDIPRTPFRRQNENNTPSGSRTAPRSSTSHSINMAGSSSIVGLPAGGNTFASNMCRQRSISHALASNEMLRLSGLPARGWHPKHRSMRPASTENIDRLTSIRAWDGTAGMSGTGHTRKPLTLPPNLTPSFLNKSPREALRRVTSLLITKKKNSKERKNKPCGDHALDTANISYDIETDTSPKASVCNHNNTSQQQQPTKPQKKKSLFKNLWKKTKHFSLDQ